MALILKTFGSMNEAVARASNLTARGFDALKRQFGG